MAKKGKVIFNEERCKGCELCIDACPKKIIKLDDKINTQGYHPAKVDEMDKCIGCAMCARVCPDVVIEVFEEEN
ncbi:4Fe-4S binding protein [Natranaerobius trueperi]|uniref:Tungsten formylmethanofuran dehydrogenase n=1 Tax=Natranaerobius trueperi TaxID=759412 RepID=A0A226BY89_9FIRM|nr:4Fe-4S binding protein [Natranaerobius trueperi]OWZ83998.1 tungsten formylmethanofuran dehydrogenase [Natranaerobius trueperi]